MKINNMPAYAMTKKYILVREVDGEYWFFSAWDDGDKANEQAISCGCEVVTADLIK
jgi:hypothetical protein